MWWGSRDPPRYRQINLQPMWEVMAFKNDEKVIDFILEFYDNTNSLTVDDCTHRNLFDIYLDHHCSPCNCGMPDCPMVVDYCYPSAVLAMHMEFVEGVEIEFDESGLPLTTNPKPLLPWDELILNG